jgi:anti-anti-sigma factor
MEIKHEQRGAVEVVAPVGRLDTDSSSDLELAIHDMLGAGSKHFVLDLSKIGYVSSAGLRVLLMLAKQLDGGRGSLRLAGLNPQVKQVFDIAGFSKLFSIYASQDAALDKHPHLAEQGVALGKIASKLMKTEARASDGVDASEVKTASAAARLLGAKAAAKPEPASAAAARPGAPSDKTMALSALKTPTAPQAATPAAPAQSANKPGFFARLFGMFRKS